MMSDLPLFPDHFYAVVAKAAFLELKQMAQHIPFFTCKHTVLPSREYHGIYLPSQCGQYLELTHSQQVKVMNMGFAINTLGKSKLSEKKLNLAAPGFQFKESIRLTDKGQKTFGIFESANARKRFFVSWAMNYYGKQAGIRQKRILGAEVLKVKEINVRVPLSHLQDVIEDLVWMPFKQQQKAGSFFQLRAKNGTGGAFKLRIETEKRRSCLYEAVFEVKTPSAWPDFEGKWVTLQRSKRTVRLRVLL